MPAKYKMKIEKIKEETEDSKSFVFVPVDSDKGLFDYMPGQFFLLEAEVARPKVMTYDKTKRMMVGSGEIAEVLERKAFSIASSPTEKDHIELLIKSEHGTFAPYFLEQAEVGDICVLDGPRGNFMNKLFQNKDNPVACWSAGSGIPSTMSLMKFALDKGLDLQIFVFDSNKTMDDIIFHDRIKRLVSESENSHSVFTITRGMDAIHQSHSPRVSYSNGRFWANGENTLEKYVGSEWKDCANTICGSSSFINGRTRDESGSIANVGNGIEDHLLEVGINKSKVDKDQFYLQ